MLAFYRSIVDSRQVNDFQRILFLIIVICLFYWFKILVLENQDVKSYIPILIVVSLLSIGLSWIRYPESARAFGILHRGVALTIGFYLAASWPSYFVPESLLSETQYSALEMARWVAAGFALASFWRPSFSILPFLYVMNAKHLTAAVAGHQITPTDYLPLIEIGVFLWLAVMVLGIAQRFLPNYAVAKSTRTPGHANIFDLLVLTAVAIHFGNYFWSAVAKVLLQGGLTTWVLENKTYYLTLAALEGGLLPISQWPAITESAYQFSVSLVLLLNVLTLVAQLYSIWAISKVRQTIYLTIFYDLTHVSIFLLTGIFFWKWILLNLVIVVSLSHLRTIKLSGLVKLYCVLLVLLGNLFFFTARLGWYDTRSLNQIRFIAISKSGEQFKVPTNYFLASSVTFAQGRIGPPGELIAGHLPVLTYGTAFEKGTKDLAEECALQLLPESGRLFEARERNLGRLVSLLKQHHNFVIGNVDKHGRIYYDLYPHHIWSNPLEFLPFATLDKREIVKYIIEIESLCLSYSEGKLRSESLAKTRRVVNVGG